MKIRINRFIPITNVEGPGSRFCLWVQGCSIRCKECANSALWDENGGIEYDTAEIKVLISKYSDKIEGITFLGGEPLNQIKAVIDIARFAKDIGLSVLVFTGYRYENLKNNEDFKELCKYVDLLIDGEYDYTKKDFSRPWVGSSNQNYYFLTDRYDNEIFQKYKNKIEIRLDKNNKIALNGMGDVSKLSNLIK